MDLRSYYRKVREAEATLTGEHIRDGEPGDSEGGKEGVRTEVPRSIAARLIAETRARVATRGRSARVSRGESRGARGNTSRKKRRSECR